MNYSCRTSKYSTDLFTQAPTLHFFHEHNFISLPPAPVLSNIIKMTENNVL